MLTAKSMCPVPHPLGYSHPEVPNSQIDIWLFSSLVECPPATKADSRDMSFLSQVALLQDGDNSCQIPSYYFIYYL